MRIKVPGSRLRRYFLLDTIQEESFCDENFEYFQILYPVRRFRKNQISSQLGRTAGRTDDHAALFLPEILSGAEQTFDVEMIEMDTSRKRPLIYFKKIFLPIVYETQGDRIRSREQTCRFQNRRIKIRILLVKKIFRIPRKIENEIFDDIESPVHLSDI